MRSTCKLDGIIKFNLTRIGCSKGNKTVPEKVATTRTEDGQK